MKAEERSIDTILTRSGSAKYFIPDYQRPYIWDPEEATQLIEDIYDSYTDNAKEYFAGSIICIRTENDDSRQQYEVVDGQQRLITLTLIMQQLAIRAKDSKIKFDLNDRILLDNPYFVDDNREPVLTVREQEREFYLNRILQDKQNFPAENDRQKAFSNNQQAINKFLSELQDVDDVNFIRQFSSYLLYNVYVVFVTVDDRASSFRLFDVLNNRGTPLSASDLIKNRLMKNADEDDNTNASKQVKEKWRQIENFVEEEDEKGEIEKFFTLHQLSEKKIRDRVKPNNFKYYDKQLKEYFNGDSVKMVETLYNSAKNYKEIITRIAESKKDVFVLGQLKWKEEWIPAFMAFLNKKFTEEQFSKFAELFEKVYMQGVLRRTVKSQREGVCYQALVAINNDNSFEDIMACVAAYADNQKFEDALEAKEFYDSSRPTIINLVKLVLLRLDRERHDDSVKVTYSHKTVTVEHILPQNKDDEYWTGRFTQEQHEEWLHKLGNLTVISRGKNSAAKNHGFDKKKVMYATSSNKKTSLEITKELCELPEWNMQALKDRHKKLKDEIKKLWGVETGL